MKLKTSVHDSDITLSSPEKTIGWTFSIIFLIAGTCFIYALNNFSFSIPETNWFYSLILYVTIVGYPVTLVAFSVISITVLHYVIGRKVDILDFMYAMNCNVLFLIAIVSLTLILV